MPETGQDLYMASTLANFEILSSKVFWNTCIFLKILEKIIRTRLNYCITYEVNEKNKLIGYWIWLLY